jgi:hypothetical protein
MGLARRGTRNNAGILEINCDGCTPAYAGPEVLDIFNQFGDGMTVEERMEIQKSNPIDMPSHDLWASALTVFQAVYRVRDGVWTSGSEGQDQISACPTLRQGRRQDE